jgi:hypothetical protein
MNVHLFTVVGGVVKILPYMLQHYRGLGVSSWLIHVHLTAEDDPARAEIERIARDLECAISSVEIGGTWTLAQRMLYRRFADQRPDDWFIFADQDELCAFRDDLPSIVDFCERHGYDHVRGCFVDRLGPGGTLARLDPARPLDGQFPLGGFITFPVLRGDPRKIVLAKGRVLLEGSGHHVALSGAACPVAEHFVQVHHYKWGDWLPAHLRERIELCRRYNNAVGAESERFLAYYERHQSRFDVDDPALLVSRCEPEYRPWTAVRDFVTAYEKGTVNPALWTAR